jgi:transglutaminase-like putative cysteine protease
MTRLAIRHVTTYRYPHAVGLGVHTLSLRPRRSRDVHVFSSLMNVSPSASIAWSEDVNGNAVASAAFATMTETLIIEYVSEIELRAVAWPVFEIACSAASYPFRYSVDDWVALGTLTVLSCADPDRLLAQWGTRLRARYHDGYVVAAQGHRHRRRRHLGTAGVGGAPHLQLPSPNYLPISVEITVLATVLFVAVDT